MLGKVEWATTPVFSEFRSNDLQSQYYSDSQTFPIQHPQKKPPSAFDARYTHSMDYGIKRFLVETPCFRRCGMQDIYVYRKTSLYGVNSRDFDNVFVLRRVRYYTPYRHHAGSERSNENSYRIGKGVCVTQISSKWN
ncbi:hypothetical protein U1Q18_051776 [Sarracenia purpurea var. burkii]